jgi:hypothetical protein
MVEGLNLQAEALLKTHRLEVVALMQDILADMCLTQILPNMLGEKSSTAIQQECTQADCSVPNKLVQAVRL